MRKLSVLAIAALLTVTAAIPTVTPAAAKPCSLCCRVIIECGI